MESHLALAKQASSVTSALPIIAIGLAGNVTTQPFGRLVEKLADCCTANLTHHDFGQPIQALLSGEKSDILIIHLDYRWFFELAPDDQSRVRMDQLLSAARARAERGDCTIVLNTIAASVSSPVRSDEAALRGALAQLNASLFSFAAETRNVTLLDLHSLAAESGHAGFFRERNRYLMQFPYSSRGQGAIVEEYAALVREHYRARRKVVVVDADNTLWRGIIGEVGPDGIGVSDEYPSVLHKIFQLQLKQLKELGFVLAAVTKNNDSDFRAAFADGRLPLTLDDFVTYRANWNEKSENIVSIASELNVGLDSMIFIDDNPFEIEEVRARASGVETHVFPHNDLEAATTLIPSIASLRSPALTTEDRAKTDQYRAEAKRSQAQSGAGSLDEYLASLEIELVMAHNRAGHIPRISQLTNKTNQFNLTTRRYTETDIRNFMTRGDVFDFRIVDKFGDMGIVGVVIVIDGKIDSFLLSCRALGRKVESEILRLVVESCGNDLTAEYIPTAKNGQTEGFFAANGFQVIEHTKGSTRYRHATTPKPSPHIKVRHD